jgi:enediyne biosynthesis protein E4
MADVVSGGSYFSQSSFTLYFGLGDAENVDRLEVRWPSGETQVWKNVAVNRTVKLSEGAKPVEGVQWVKPAVEK